jgi:Arc/MetJ-type ribon-helix-helix transcriptional regulator
MTTLRIAIPDETNEFLRAEAERGSYGNPENYVRHLIDEARDRQSQKHLEDLLLAGLETPAEPWSSEDFRKLRARYEAED